MGQDADIASVIIHLSLAAAEVMGVAQHFYSLRRFQNPARLTRSQALVFPTISVLSFLCKLSTELAFAARLFRRHGSAHLYCCILTIFT